MKKHQKKSKLSRQEKYSNSKIRTGPLDPSLNTSLDNISRLGYLCDTESLKKCLKEVQKPHPRRVLEIIQIMSKLKNIDHDISNQKYPSEGYRQQVIKEKEIRNKLISDILKTITDKH